MQGGSESHSIHCPTKTVVWDCDIGTDHPDVPAFTLSENGIRLSQEPAWRLFYLVSNLMSGHDCIKNRNHRSKFSTGTLVRQFQQKPSLEFPCSVHRSKIPVRLPQSASYFLQYYLTFSQNWAFRSQHGNWASVAKSHLPLNSRRVSFIVLVSLARPVHSTSDFAKLF